MKASDWINVKDGLPRVNRGVFVCCQSGDEQWLKEEGFYDFDVTLKDGMEDL